ncbi:unnamed protein product [Anisakis simplex]|uniref:CRAL-TRIO domain-containing protein n=1 Tax=Anisakis simplex TaxID=6269 RepID=A0A0M3KEE9_ANISI|nr:unnamed protein product [Anisakis simplex]
MHKRPRNHMLHKYVPNGLTGYSKVLKNTVVQIEQNSSLYEVAKREAVCDRPYLCLGLFIFSLGEQASAMFILDLTDLKYTMSLYQFCAGHLRNVAEFLDQQYVQVIKQVVVINVPVFAYAIWKTLRPLIPSYFQRKVHLLSPSNWRKEILAYADPSVLPSFWNLHGEDLFKAAVEKPLELTSDKFYKLKIPEGAKEVHIAPRQSRFFCYKANKGDIVNTWVICDGNYAGGVYFTEDENEEDFKKMRAIYPCFATVIGPTYVPITHSFVAEQTGVYKFWFTNEKAWLHTLKIHIYANICDKHLYPPDF